MPRIIRSSGVNIERARPIVIPVREKPPEAPPPPPPPAEAKPEAPPEEAPRQPDMGQIYASAETVVEEIIAKARYDADSMLVDARRETIKVLQDAVREGWDKGIAEAREEMRAAQEAAEHKVEEAVRSLLDERRQIIRDLERDIVGLVFDIAEKVLSIEMNRSDAWIEAMVKKALAELEDDDGVVIKVASPVRQRVAEIAENMLSAAGRTPAKLTVAADSALEPGGCVIETVKGDIDTSVEHKFGKLKTALMENA